MTKSLNNTFVLFVVFAAIITGFALAMPITNAQNQTVEIENGDVIAAHGNKDVYIVKDIAEGKFKRLILNPAIFDSYEHLRWKDIKYVDSSVLDEYETSTLVQYHYDDGRIADYRIFKLYPEGDYGIKRHIDVSPEEFESCFNMASVFSINSEEIGERFYRTGPPIANIGIEECNINYNRPISIINETNTNESDNFEGMYEVIDIKKESDTAVEPTNIDTSDIVPGSVGELPISNIDPTLPDPDYICTLYGC